MRIYSWLLICAAIVMLVTGLVYAERQTLTVTAAPGKYSANGQQITMTAADASNKEQFTASGSDLIIAHNTDSGSHSVTITSVADAYGRTGDITNTIAAGAIYTFGPFPTVAWAQSNGKIYLEADSATVKWGVVRLP